MLAIQIGTIKMGELVLFPAIRSEKEVNYFMKKIEEYERKTNTKVPKSMPISRTHKYFKIYIFEKVNANKVIRREVEWQYATF